MPLDSAPSMVSKTVKLRSYRLLLAAIVATNVAFIYLICVSSNPAQEDAAGENTAPATRGAAGDGAATLLSIDAYRSALSTARQALQQHYWGQYDAPLSEHLTPEVSQSIWEQARRLEQLSDLCQDHRRETSGNSYKAVAFPPRLPVGFCINPKAGVTTWVQYLLLWSGLQYPEELVHDASYEHFHWFQSRGEAEQHLADHRPLMVLPVRHPYDRLVSLYAEKFVDDEDPALADFKASCLFDLQSNLDERWYKKSEMERNQSLRFRDFVHCLLKMFSLCGGDSRCLSRIEPHLRPMHLVCPPCDGSYDVIARFASLNEDAELVRLLLNSEALAALPSAGKDDHGLPREGSPGAKEVDHSQSSPLKRAVLEDPLALKALSTKGTLRLNRSKRRGGSREVTELLQQLSRKERAQLRELYKYDFLLFGYDADEYTNLVDEM